MLAAYLSYSHKSGVNLLICLSAINRIDLFSPNCRTIPLRDYFVYRRLYYLHNLVLCCFRRRMRGEYRSMTEEKKNNLQTMILAVEDIKPIRNYETSVFMLRFEYVSQVMLHLVFFFLALYPFQSYVKKKGFKVYSVFYACTLRCMFT